MADEEVRTKENLEVHSYSEYEIAINHALKRVDVVLNQMHSTDRPDLADTLHEFEASTLILKVHALLKQRADYSVNIRLHDDTIRETAYMASRRRKYEFGRVPRLDTNLRAQEHIDKAGNNLYKLQDTASVVARTVQDFKNHYFFIGKEYEKMSVMFDDIIGRYQKSHKKEYGDAETPHEEQVMLGLLEDKKEYFMTVAKNLQMIGK